MATSETDSATVFRTNRPQYRAQTLRTLKLLWNALYLGGLQEVELK